MLLKKIVSRGAHKLGYEIRKRPASGLPVGELAGITFSDFMFYYLSSQDLSDFVFIQIGAHNGVSNDWLYAFVRRFHLRGILLEPQSCAFRELQKNYKDCPQVVLENLAVAKESGTQKLFTVKKELDFLQYANQAASFNYAHTNTQLARHLSNGAPREVRGKLRELKLQVADCIEAETVPTCTFEALLGKHGLERYDLLQIDTEGFDYEIIKMANIQKFKPRLINYEHEHLSERDQRECWGQLQGYGYHVFTHNGDTTAYFQRD